MARPQPEPSLYEDVGPTEISQLATEWRERLEFTSAEEDVEPGSSPLREAPRLTLAEGLPPALPGVRSSQPPSQRRHSQPLPVSAPPSRSALGPEPLPAPPRSSRVSESLAALRPPSRVSEPLAVLGPPSRVSSQLAVLGPPSRVSGQLAVLGPPSRVSSQLAVLAPPPRSSDPSLHGPAMAARIPSPEPLPASAEQPSGNKTQVLALLTVAVLSLAVNALVLFRGQLPWRTAPAGGLAASASASAPAPAPVNAPAAASAAQVAAAACLRDNTQTIASEERDELLLRAVQAFENGKHEQAHNLFLRYVHEACDAATLEAVSILNRERETPAGDKGGAR